MGSPGTTWRAVYVLLVALALLYGLVERRRRNRMVPHVPSPPFVSYTDARDWLPDDDVLLQEVVALMRREISTRREACMLAPDVNVDLRIAVLAGGTALINPHAVNASREVHYVVRDVNGFPREVLVHNAITYEYLGAFLERTTTTFVRGEAECLQTLLSA